jgi:hypothetical protein
MPSSYTTNLRFEQQFTGENVNTWGVRLNNMLARLDDSIAGYVPIAITGDTTITSANDNTTADQARRAHLKFTGTLSANATITLPSVAKSYWVWNATNKTLTFSLGSGNTATVESGDKLQVWSDGTNVNQIAFGTYNLKDYIAAQTASAGAVPGTTGSLGKFLKVTVDGAASTWQQIQSTDIGDFDAAVRQKALIYTLIFAS